MCKRSTHALGTKVGKKQVYSVLFLTLDQNFTPLSLKLRIRVLEERVIDEVIDEAKRGLSIREYGSRRTELMWLIQERPHGLKELSITIMLSITTLSSVTQLLSMRCYELE